MRILLPYGESKLPVYSVESRHLLKILIAKASQAAVVGLEEGHRGVGSYLHSINLSLQSLFVCFRLPPSLGELKTPGQLYVANQARHTMRSMAIYKWSSFLHVGCATEC